MTARVSTEGGSSKHFIENHPITRQGQEQAVMFLQCDLLKMTGVLNDDVYEGEKDDLIHYIIDIDTMDGYNSEKSKLR